MGRKGMHGTGRKIEGFPVTDLQTAMRLEGIGGDRIAFCIRNLLI
jgi:hypothetical protein